MGRLDGWLRAWEGAEKRRGLALKRRRGGVEEICQRAEPGSERGWSFRGQAPAGEEAGDLCQG